MPKSISPSDQRIGILGGTFDPVHHGHLGAAQAVVHALSLDAVLFIPSCRPPHKVKTSVLSFDHRCAMLDLALAEREKFHVSHLEAARGGPSYTCDTLTDLRCILGADRKLFFISGIDAFNEIHTWKNYKSLPRYAEFAILGRPPHRQDRLLAYITETFPDYSTCPSRFHLVSMIPIDISSTAIRQKSGNNLPIDQLTSKEVVSYIAKEGLYRT